MKKDTRFSWWIIVGLLLLATSLSFLDRQVLSISILKIKEDLSISDIEYGFINSGFLISYAVMFTLGGVLIDRYGSRLGLAFSVGFWSFATLLHSLSSSVFHFGLFRFLLGAGEGGCFPGAIKAVMEWVPKNKHAMANGIAIGGSAIGAVIAPPLCVYLLGIVGWRAVFLISGGFGFIWLIAWLVFTRSKKQSFLSSEETGNTSKNNTKRVEFFKLLKNKEVLVFITIRFLLDPIFYFYMFWIPKYLNEVHSLSLEVIGKILWIPFLALGLANVLGGWFSDLIFSKTSSINNSRKLVMGAAAALTIPIVFTGFIHSYILILTLMTLAFFAHGLWITNYITSIGDIFGKSLTSTVVGLSGSAGALSSLVLNPFIGYVITNYSYSPLWWYVGLMYPAAFVLFVWFIPRIELKSMFLITTTA
ncbi:MAG: MFS transporter [Prolixibacteraceae bacterium]|nr:MFS transporter [Prolixibacteraceae bacterium]